MAVSMEFLKDFVGFVVTKTNVKWEKDTDTKTNSQYISESELSNESSLAASCSHCTLNSGLRKRKFDNQRQVEKVISYLEPKEPDQLSLTEHIMLGYVKTIDSLSN